MDLAVILIRADGKSRGVIVDAALSPQNRPIAPNELEVNGRTYRHGQMVVGKDGFIYHLYVERCGAARERFALTVCKGQLIQTGVING